MFIVYVEVDDHDNDRTFGPFDLQEDAEKCVAILAGRPNVLQAVIKPLHESKKTE